MKKPLINKDKLTELYCDKLLSLVDIQKQTGIGRHTLANYMKLYNIKTRSIEDRFNLPGVRESIAQTTRLQFQDPVKRENHRKANIIAHAKAEVRLAIRMGMLNSPVSLQNSRKQLADFKKRTTGTKYLSDMQKEIQNRPSVILKKRIGSTNYQNLPIVREISRLRGIKNWENTEYAQSVIKSNRESPNELEIKMGQIIEDICPNQYKYTGDGSRPVGRYHPDFTHKDNIKLIEVYGKKWHADPFTYSPLEIVRHGLMAQEIWGKNVLRELALVKLGKRVLIIWQRELKDREILKKKILDFTNEN